MKLKSVLSKMACWQKVKIIDYSKQEIIYNGMVSGISKDLKEKQVGFIGISNFYKEIMIDVFMGD